MVLYITELHYITGKIALSTTLFLKAAFPIGENEVYFMKKERALVYAKNVGGRGEEMERNLAVLYRLQKPYIQIKRENGELTYGGDQGFFKKSKAGSVDALKSAMGCGVVAFSDLVLYLGIGKKKKSIAESMCYVNQKKEEKAYCQYYNCIYDFLGGVSRINGIGGLRLMWGFHRLAKGGQERLRAVWGLSANKLYNRVEEMLKQDIPVILCIPMMLLKKDKKDGLTFYQRSGEEWQVRTVVSGHYVMVTGIVQECGSGEIFMEISSWGKKYYINWNEYEKLIRTHFLGTILGNILYIRKR